MKLDRKVVVAAAAAFALAWFIARSDGGIPNPFVPEAAGRPVLKFIAKLAKTFLWVAVVAEPRPDVSHHHHYVQSVVGPDGHELLDHAEGF